MTDQVETYLLEGCGRCPLGGTPDCKVHRWIRELNELRRIVWDCGLVEEAKWGVPCYTFQKKNVLLISAFKEYCAISFFKGSLLSNDNKLLVKPGKNAQAARLLTFTGREQILKKEDEIKTIIFEAIEVEKAGLTVHFQKNPDPIPEELHRRFEQDPLLTSAFEALTPGRQRGYILYFSAPKQSKTRESRIDKCIGNILNGEGLHDTYKGRKRR
ncbi:MAG: YdeI/OmpD-associated family protein [Bacteroidota bacterium]